MFLIDTDHFSILQRPKAPEFQKLWGRINSFDASAFFVLIVAFQEQVAGWNGYISKARHTEGLVRAYRMFEQILVDFAAAQVAAFDQPAASRAEALRAAKIRVSTMDLRIAAIALTHDWTLLTRNTLDFQKVPGLKVEDWTR